MSLNKYIVRMIVVDFEVSFVELVEQVLDKRCLFALFDLVSEYGM
jgi:hypothetical protein